MSNTFVSTICVKCSLTFALVISTKRAEGNYIEAAAEVSKLIADYNTMLCSSLSV